MAPPGIKFDSESILALGEFVSPTIGIIDKQQAPQRKEEDEQQNQLVTKVLKKEQEAFDAVTAIIDELSVEVLAKKKLLMMDQARVDQGNMHLARMFAAQRMQLGKNEAFAVFNVDTVVDRFVQWHENMPRVKPFYAVKCNNDRVLLATLAKLGAGFDCASREEIDLILGSGFAQPDNIVYANTCKSPQFIRHAASRGVNRFTFDCVEELAKMKREHQSAEMILRIDVSDASATRPLDMKFGCNPVTDAPRLLQAAVQMGMQIIGISFHVGSGCQNPLVYREAIAMARKLFKMGEQLGHEMRVLDLGGGFPGCAEEREFFDRISNVINDALDEFFPTADREDSGNESESDNSAINRANLEIIAEPGRYFASSPTSVCANVIGATQVSARKLTKSAEDEHSEAYMYYLDDGVYGSFSCISSRLFTKVPSGIPLFHRVKENQKEQFLSVVWGPTCDTRDQVEELCLKSRLLPGDWLYYSDMGAYTRVTATGFNGFHRPSDVYYVVGKQTWDALSSGVNYTKAMTMEEEPFA